MDRHETKLRIESFFKSKRRLDACIDTAERLFGDQIIEGEFCTVAYQLLEQQVELIETASDLPVDLSWFIWDNDCGRNGYEAGVDGDVRAVKTVEDLLDLAEREVKR